MDKMYMEELKCPQIQNLQEITPELFKEYVTFVRNLRHNQKRWFNLHNFEALKISKEMETKLDKLNDMLLDETPKLF